MDFGRIPGSGDQNASAGRRHPWYGSDMKPTPLTTDPGFDDWLGAARQGSQEAWDRVLAQTQRYLLAVAQAELGSTLRPKASPSDIVQESLLDVQKGFDGFQGQTREEFLGWAVRILKTNLADLGRRFRQAECRDIRREQMGTDLQAMRGPTTADPAQWIVAQEQRLQLQRAIERLPLELRQILIWRQRDRIGWDEIGQRLGKTADAVRKMWSRAVMRLRGELNEDTPTS